MSPFPWPAFFLVSVDLDQYVDVESMKEAMISFLSFSLFCLSIFLFKRSVSRAWLRYFYGSFLFFYLLTFSFYIVSDYFTGEGINEGTIYHIVYGFDGAGFLEFINIIVAGAALLIICIFLPVYLVRNKQEQGKKSLTGFKVAVPFLLVVGAQVMNPATIDVYSLSINRIPQEEGYNGGSFNDYYRSSGGSIESKNLKNIVFIYLESLERTYFDEQLFPGLVKQLKKLEKKSISFTNIVQIGNAGWTIAGMVASQCGIPLYTPSAGNSMGGIDVFLPGAYCLGDRLRDEGYKLSYFGGAALSFAGKGKFFVTHGFTDINGRNELIPLLTNKDYKSFWGVYDDSLFDIAFKRYIELSKTKEKFGLFLLTLDTHHPDGHPSASCEDVLYGDGTNSILNAVACTDQLVGNFVDRIRKSRYGKDTIIVIASDHLAMRNTATNLLIMGDRKNLFMILDPSLEHSETIEKKGSTYDIASTVLPFVGFSGEIGLGRDLAGDREPLLNIFADLNKQLNAWRGPIGKFWQFPKIEKFLEIVSTGMVRIDERSFALPILIKLNHDLDTEIKFETDLSAGHKNLRDYIYNFDSSTPFIWVDACSNMQIGTFASKVKGKTCMAIGRLGTKSNQRIFHGNILNVDSHLVVSADELKDMLFSYSPSVKARLMN